jgi:hypothetical protein
MNAEFHALAALSQIKNFVMLYCLSVDCEQGIPQVSESRFLHAKFLMMF